MRIFWLWWEKLAHVRLIWRVAIKALILGSVIFIVLYPHPVLFFEQLRHYWNAEALIQPDFPGMAGINREIDAALPLHASKDEEFQAIQRYVYEHIRYEYDWRNWGNLDYWPSAAQVWQRQREDCDGQAILAVSILRSRGFATAKLVGNFRHIWVAVERQELMEPDTEQTFTQEGGKTIVALPSREMIFNSIAFYVAAFPAMRNLSIYLTLLLLCYHPAPDPTRFFGLTSLGLTGFVWLKDWALAVRRAGVAYLDVDFIGGCGLMGAAVLLSLALPHIGKRKT